MKRCCESKGIASTRGQSRRWSSGERPAFIATTSSAPSIGSPSTCIPPARASTVASLQSRPALRISPSSVSSPGPPAIAAASPAEASHTEKSPTGSYPVPETRYVCSPVATVATVISFRVSVPVLSEQITDTDPSVSIAGSWRTIALRRAMPCTPIASVTVRIVGSPSGIAATAMPTTAMKISANA